MTTDLLEQTLPHIQNAMYPRRIPLLDWKMKEGAIPGGARNVFKEKGFAEIRIPFEWGKYDRTVWFRTQLVLPDEFAGKRVGIRLNFPESLVYLNGKPVQGFDNHHMEAILFEKARRNQQLSIAVEAYSGRTRDRHLFEIAELVEINPVARIYHTALLTLKEIESALDARSQALSSVRELIRRLLIYVKYYDPASEEYANAIARGVAFLRAALKEESPTVAAGTVHAVGQSHLDIVWLWRLAETIRKAGGTFSTALGLTERFPEFRYPQSQAALYDLARHEYPALHSDIRSAIESGRWEVVGQSWVEPDCNIPSGESLVRQILHGSRYFEGEFGASSEVFWLPDTFGFAWSLPQIIKKSGMKYFFTTKLRWNDTSKFPHTAFHWQGIDGSTVLAYVPKLGLEADLRPKDLLTTMTALEEGESSPPAMQTFGYGDGGGGVTPEQIESMEVYASVPGMPKTILSTPSQFFRALEEHESQFPTWNGELYLEKHRGTYTTHGWIKKANRDLENSLYAAEVLSCMSELLPGAKRKKYPEADLEKSWKKLLLNQFHDILPGTFIRDAAGDIASDYESAQDIADAVLQRSARSLLSPHKRSRGESWFTVINTLAFARPAYVEVDLPFSARSYDVVDQQGSPIEAQVIEKRKSYGRLLLYLPSVPATGSVAVCVRASDDPPDETESEWKFSSRAIESSLLRIRFDNKGDLSSIFDKTLKKEIIHKGKRGNLFQAYQDKPAEWEAWEIPHDMDRHKLDLFTLKASKTVEEGPLRVGIVQEYRSRRGSTIKQHIYLYHRSARIDFDTVIKWKEEQTFLKVIFPLAPRTTSASYEIQFGTIDRPNRSKVPSDKAKYEVPAQRWAALSDNKFGAAVLNDSKYGYDCKDHTLRLSLIRSPHYPHPSDPWHLTDPQVTDQGEHRFRYAVYPFQGDWRNGDVVPEARSFNVRPVVLKGRPKRPLPSLLSVNKPGVAVSAFKKADNGKGYIVRLYEAHGKPTSCSLSLLKPPTYVGECDLIERDLKSLSAKKGRLTVHLKPFEIRTFRILFSGKGPRIS